MNVCIELFTCFVYDDDVRSKIAAVMPFLSHCSLLRILMSLIYLAIQKSFVTGWFFSYVLYPLLL